MKSKFRPALFGYSKRDVCEYISSTCDALISKHTEEKKKLEEEKAKLGDEIVALKKSREEAESKILEFSAKIKELEAEIAHMKDDNSKVSEIIVDARRFADELKTKAEDENKKEIAANSKRNAEIEEKIKDVRDEVDEIRAFLAKFLVSADKELGDIQKDLDSVELVDENPQKKSNLRVLA